MWRGYGGGRIRNRGRLVKGCNWRSSARVSGSECDEAAEVGESGTGAGAGSQKVTIGDPQPGSVGVNVAGLRKWEVQEQGQGQTHKRWQLDILGQGK